MQAHRPLTRTLSLFLALAAASALAGTKVITIASQRAPVMDGKKTLAWLARGMKLKVEKTSGDWYAVRVKVGGEAMLGWVHKKHVGTGTASAPADTLEEAARKEYERLKAEAEKLVAEGKLDAAVAALDQYPPKYWKTKWANEIRKFGLELEARAQAKPELLDKSARKEFDARKAKADALFKEGKVQDALQVLENFPARFEKTEWAKKAEDHRLELARRANAPFEKLHKQVFDLVAADRFDDAHQAVDAVKDKLPGGGTQVHDIETFIDLHEKAAGKDSLDNSRFATDVYHSDAEYRKHLFTLAHIVAPPGAGAIRIKRGDQVITQRVLQPAEQIAVGEKLLGKYPLSPNVRMAMARLYSRASRPADAVKMYQEARRLDLGHSIVSVDACIEQGRVQTLGQEAGDAVAALEEALELHPDDFVALSALGRAHLVAGDKAQAIAAWQKSLSVFPHQPQIVRELTRAKGQEISGEKPPKLKLVDLVARVQESCLVIRAQQGLGSGFAVRADGLISTNFHVIAPGAPWRVGVKRKGADKPTYVTDVQLVLADPFRDIALLKIDNRIHKLKPLPLGSAKDVVAAEDVVVIGNPGGLDYTITKGIVSNRKRTLPNGCHYIQTDAAVNPGNSGGPLFNLRAQVVGMVTLKSHTMERTGFALHIDHVRTTLAKCFPNSQ